MMTISKRIVAMLTVMAAVAIALPSRADASGFFGPITSVSSTSLSVRDKEVMTVTLDNRTVYTKLITQKPWQEDTRLTADALAVGRLVVVHVRSDNPGIARWVQIATDVRVATFAPAAVVAPAQDLTATYTREGLKHLAEARALRAAPTASESKRPGSVDTAAYHERIAEQGRIVSSVPSEEVIAPVTSEAAMHRAEAAARRASPNAAESKRPGSPDTALHCDRIADRLEKSAGK
jgi:hypothetical protein